MHPYPYTAEQVIKNDFQLYMRDLIPQNNEILLPPKLEQVIPAYRCDNIPINTEVTIPERVDINELQEGRDQFADLYKTKCLQRDLDDKLNVLDPNIILNQNILILIKISFNGETFFRFFPQSDYLIKDDNTIADPVAAYRYYLSRLVDSGLKLDLENIEHDIPNGFNIQYIIDTYQKQCNYRLSFDNLNEITQICKDLKEIDTHLCQLRDKISAINSKIPLYELPHLTLIKDISQNNDKDCQNNNRIPPPSDYQDLRVAQRILDTSDYQLMESKFIREPREVPGFDPNEKTYFTFNNIEYIAIWYPRIGRIILGEKRYELKYLPEFVKIMDLTEKDYLNLKAFCQEDLNNYAESDNPEEIGVFIRDCLTKISDKANESIIKQMILSQYTITDSILDRIKFDDLKNTIQSLNSFTSYHSSLAETIIGNKVEFKIPSNVKLARIFTKLGLQKRRYSDGMYWYGLKNKSNNTQ